MRDLASVDVGEVALVGGKGAALGRLLQLPDLAVPAGFVVTTDAFRRVVAGIPGWADLVAALTDPGVGDPAVAATRSAAVREAILEAAVPEEIAAGIAQAVRQVIGADVPCAVRSSATTEDAHEASSAGLHDSELDVVGADAVLAAVRRCWASLYTDRAVADRRRRAGTSRAAAPGAARGDEIPPTRTPTRAGVARAAEVAMAVVVQRMVPADAAGVLFTADPLSGDRRVGVVEAVAGLGDALVGGDVTPATWRVRDGQVVERSAPADGPAPVLDDGQVLRLVELGRRIEAHLGHPEDIEWCLVGDDPWVVQSRPITTLFPIPATADPGTRVYVSVGHQQMMTDPMRPLGLAVWQLVSRAPMRVAGSRLFVDVAAQLASPAIRDGLVAGLGRSDPLIGDALRTILERGDVPLVEPGVEPPRMPPGISPPDPIEADPAIVRDLVARAEASTAAAEERLRGLSGPAVVDAIRADVADLQRTVFDPRSLQVITAAIDAMWWLDEHLERWLGEAGAADVLARAVPGDVTAEMGLALLDVADAIRPHPQVVGLLERIAADPAAEGGDVGGDRLLDRLAEVEGGAAARRGLTGWLDRYGMRCPGEIDLTRPRWHEAPTALVPLLLSAVRTLPPGERERRLARGRQEAAEARTAILSRLRALPDGEAMAAEADRMIERLRTFVGYREHPKSIMVRRFGLYRQAVLEEADRLVAAGVLRERDDALFLDLDELQAVSRSGVVDHGLIAARRADFTGATALTPPRVMTSHGEVVAGTYGRTEVPPGTLVGLAVSAGTVEGRARVVVDLARADLEPGDILVTTATDPAWTPAFATISGLVTEVGGLTTHGAIIAREYGLPAVVGVQDATRLIRDGQRIRVDGAAGLVEIRQG